MDELKLCCDCDNCKHHDVFWTGGGCNLLNNMERCKYESKQKRRAGEEQQDG